MKLALKIKQAFILFSLLTFCVNSINAGIVYTDIADGVPEGIDFNQDGTYEFDIDEMTVPGDYITCYSYGEDNNIHAIDADHWDVPACVGVGFIIDATDNWLGYGDCSIDGWGEGNSTLSSNQDNYLGMRFNIGTDVFYGWVRFFYDGSGNITYKDYAYNDVANGAINAGEMGGSAILVSSIQVTGAGNQNEIIVLDGTLQMDANVLPANADDNSVTWSVENNSGVASINQSGLLQAVSDGTVTVKATANDGSDVFGTLIVTISNQSVLVTSIQITGAGNQTSISTQGGSLQMIATVYPVNADNSDVSWTVINTIGSASIDQSGMLEAISDGLVTVKATAIDGSGVFGTIDITITNQSVGVYSNINENVNIYPNPSSSQINISGNRDLNSELTIYSTDGKIVMSKNLQSTDSEIDISSLEKGVYYIIIKSENEITYSKSLVKI